jgi:hypothetical protein
VTPAEETRVIALWQAGIETAEIGRHLGIPHGTVASRAHALRQQGKIQARPKGGNYPRSKAKVRHVPPSQAPVQSGAGLPPLSPEEARADRWNLWLPPWAQALGRGHGEDPRACPE